MALSFDMRVSIPSHVLTRRLDDELVLLNLDNESYFGLDEIGSRMIEAVAAAPTILVAVDQLLGEFAVDAGQLRIDVAKLLAELAENGLVEFHDA